MTSSAELPTSTRWIVRILRPWFMALTRRDWQGVEKLPSGGFVLAANHLSHIDPLLLSHFMVDNGITPRFLTKDSLFRVRFLGSIVQRSEMIPVARSTAGAVDSLRAAVAAVREGKVVTIYPEGTITRDPAAWPMSGRTGAVRVALEAGVPLVPVAQWGPQEILWPYTKRPRILPRKTMRMVVGDPIDLSELTEARQACQDSEVEERLIAEATERLMDTLTAMVAQIRAELPPRERLDVHTLAKPKPAIEDREQQ